MNKTIQEDSNTMKVFSQVTLILLPMTVVSALFATDIVRFKDTPDFVGSWSGPAAIWWTCATLIATALVYYASEFLRRQLPRPEDGYERVDEGEGEGEGEVEALRGDGRRASMHGGTLGLKPSGGSWFPFRFDLFGRRGQGVVINAEHEMIEYGSSDDKADTGTKGGWASVSDWVVGTVKELRGRSGSESREAHHV